MKLFPQPIIEKLAENGRANAERMADDGATHDFWFCRKDLMRSETI